MDCYGKSRSRTQARNGGTVDDGIARRMKDLLVVYDGGEDELADERACSGIAGVG